MKQHITLISILCGISVTHSHAALFAFQSGNTLNSGTPLSGTVTTEGWDNLTTGRITNNPSTPGDNTTRPYGYHNLSNAWTGAPIVSNIGSQAGSSVLNKSGGYGYIATSSLHQGQSGGGILPGGNFSIAGTAIASLQTIIFQIKATDRNENIFNALPTLSINSVSQGNADDSMLYQTIDNYSAGFGGQDMDWYAFQWDLRTLNLTGGESFSINWTGLSNSGIYELQINQGSAYTQVIPEPSSLALLGLGALPFLRRKR